MFDDLCAAHVSFSGSDITRKENRVFCFPFIYVTLNNTNTQIPMPTTILEQTSTKGELSLKRLLLEDP